MTSFEALFLGVLQGVAEFLPISSSAHLKLARFFLGIEGGEEEIFFDLCCHAGSLIALLYFFRREIKTLARGRFEEIKPFLYALLPLFPLYTLLKAIGKGTQPLWLLGVGLIGTSFFLFLGGSRRFQGLIKPRHQRSVFLSIGSMQALALLPGISRSGATISTALLLGWSAKQAVRFSFLLSIVTILGGISLEIFQIICGEKTLSVPVTSCLLGFISSALMGLAIVSPALHLLEKGSFKPFGWYCLILGIFVMIGLR